MSSVERSATNGPSAVVLSGGASLGAAQVGMLRAIVEVGTPIDLVVGTSVGAFNAAWLADHPGPRGIDGLVDVWKSLRRRDVFPLNPRHSLAAIRGRRPSIASDKGLRSLLSRHLSFERLEDSAIPLHVVAVDVQSGRDVLLSSGPAVDAIVASASIPGLLPPVEIAGRWYMDGGVVNNTPISYAVGLRARIVWVVPAGFPCALSHPPTSALSMALQGLSTLVQHRLAQDAMRFHDEVVLRVVPPLCPVNVAPADFSQSGELIERAYASTVAWLVNGCPDVSASLYPHDHLATAPTNPIDSTFSEPAHD
ncbi:MAG TPA: patatin-like phospholipase family protein [Acidimicrobiales bacterium]|nr:patatin-like phospholipase family protein [Acidimicrobiales bacterium]